MREQPKERRGDGGSRGAAPGSNLKDKHGRPGEEGRGWARRGGSSISISRGKLARDKIHPAAP